jgi:hypothetical protein
LPVDENVKLLKRYNYINTRLYKTMVAHFSRTPEWEVKCALGYHLWLVTEHATELRKRVTEMREPPLHLDDVPDDRLQLLMDEVLRADTTLELLTGVYRVIIRELARAAQHHLEITHPLFDQPTSRVLKRIIEEELDMFRWGEQTIEALIVTEEDRNKALAWEQHLVWFLHHAEGADQTLQPLNLPEPSRRSDGNPYKVDPTPHRDDRFQDSFNHSADVHNYYKDESRSLLERTYTLIHKRLREMAVSEWQAAFIAGTEGKPWEYYHDMGRQLWDETRHAMMGEVGLADIGIPFYKYPLEITPSYVLNTRYKPEEIHLVLWTIEQGLMPKKTGKYYEWDIAMKAGHELSAYFQDHDWADEVLHAQFGRKWIVPEFGGLEQALQIGQDVFNRYVTDYDKVQSFSTHVEWWPDYIADVTKRVNDPK